MRSPNNYPRNKSDSDKDIVRVGVIKQNVLVIGVSWKCLSRSAGRHITDTLGNLVEIGEKSYDTDGCPVVYSCSKKKYNEFISFRCSMSRVSCLYR